MPSLRHLAPLFLVVACDGNGTLPPDRDPYVPGEPTVLDCIPNLDGRIGAEEIPLVFGMPVAYLVSPVDTVREVDLEGREDAGTLRWDLSTDYADDQIARLGPDPLDGRWYADRFPPDAFVAPFDGGGTIETISRQDGEGLHLLGLASSEPDPPEGRTLLVYDEPVTLLSFPVEPGTAMTSVGRIEDATFYGIPYAATDTYEVEVDAVGELAVPSLTFTQAHRVRTSLSVEPTLGEPASVKQVSFFFECFGEIARATSRPGESADDFTEAAELRRIGQ